MFIDLTEEELTEEERYIAAKYHISGSSIFWLFS
jgi:hypothetical protein